MKTLTRLAFTLSLAATNAKNLEITLFGAVPDDPSFNVTNKDAINSALAAADEGDVVVVPAGTWHLVGGVLAYDLVGVTLQIDGLLNFVADLDHWPQGREGSPDYYLNGIELNHGSQLTVTSSAPDGGTLNGNGKLWWNKMLSGALPAGGCRPRLVSILNCTDVLVENLHLINSPEKHLMFNVVRGEVRYVTVLVDRRYQQDLKQKMREKRLAEHPKLAAIVAQAAASSTSLFGSPPPPPPPSATASPSPPGDGNGVAVPPTPWLQPEDLNTDGIDPSGTNIWVHDCSVLNDDDSIAVKPSGRGTVGQDGTVYDCTQDVLLENLVLTGFGASVGSVGPSSSNSCVDRVVFRNLSMPYSGKGVYVKSNADPCTQEGVTSQLSNVLFEGVYVFKPAWWAVWVGPQQQSEPHEPDSNSGKCSLAYPLVNHCPTQGCADFRNITLKDVVIEDPLLSPGVLLGNASNPMQVHFDNVTVVKGANPARGVWPFGATYQVTATDGTCRNGCDPLPAGFTEP